MKQFIFDSKVKRVVIDTVTLRLDADDESEAFTKATKVLESFPDPHPEEGVDYCYIENRENLSSQPINVTIRKERGPTSA